MQQINTYTRRFLLIAGLLTAGLLANAYSGDSLNLRDQQNQKQGWWKVFNMDGKYKGYDAGQLVEEGEYLNNRKTGVWTKYYPNGNKKHELTFANNVANGYAKIYYRTGQLQEEGIWKVNRWVGDYKYYYKDGTLKYDWSYNSSGKREGKQLYFHENGVVQFVGNWKGGKETGELVEYHEDGSVKTKRYFEGGNVVEDKTVTLVAGKEFDDNRKRYSGKPKDKQVALGELPDGYHKLYNKDGTLSKEGIFKDKMLIDGTIFVYENGRLEKSIVVKNGKRTNEEVASSR